jgi:hypothetical protein
MTRADEDERILRNITSLDEALVVGLQRYATASGKPFEQKRM